MTKTGYLRGETDAMNPAAASSTSQSMTPTPSKRRKMQSHPSDSSVDTLLGVPRSHVLETASDLQAQAEELAATPLPPARGAIKSHALRKRPAAHSNQPHHSVTTKNMGLVKLNTDCNRTFLRKFDPDQAKWTQIVDIRKAACEKHHAVGMKILKYLEEHNTTKEKVQQNIKPLYIAEATIDQAKMKEKATKDSEDEGVEEDEGEEEDGEQDDDIMVFSSDSPDE